MIKPRLYKWDLSDASMGLLFFAQILEELLFHHTIDSFKAPALNTHTNILELNLLASELIKGRVKPAALNPVVEELENRFKNDPIIKEDMPELSTQYLKNLKELTKNPEDLRATTRALLTEIADKYWYLLRRKIEQTVAYPNEKKKLTELAVALTAEIELRGYSKQFLYFMTLNYFFNWTALPRKINSHSQIKAFLDIFEGKDISWKIIFRGSAEFSQLKKVAENLDVKILDTLPSEIESRKHLHGLLGINEQYTQYIIFDKIKTKDRFIARQLANSSIELLADIYRFYDHHRKPTWLQNCVVKRDGEEEYFVVKSPPAPMERGTVTRAKFVGNFDETIETLGKGKFDESSINLFVKAMDYHRTAIEGVAPENQLVSLWAALEGFLPPPREDDGQARITQYLNYLLPSLTLTYVEKIFKDTSENLFHGGYSVRNYIEELPVEGNFFDKSICLLISSDLKDCRLHIYGLLEKHPLLKNRCYWCHEKFHKPEIIKETISSHRQRVAWHIQRIYTTRNQIVHSASALPYLNTLVENLHTYFDILMNALIRLSDKISVRLSIETSLRMLQLHEKAYLENLNCGSIECSSNTYKHLLFGRDNPLSPYFTSINKK